jgi:protein-tyrosine phosphatase
MQVRGVARTARGDDLAPAAERSWRRRGLIATLGYVTLVVGSMIVTEAVVLVSRVFGDDVRSELSGVPNFRVVDERVWAGGQPAADDVYRKLADRGVVLIVDLRTGAPDDERLDDPDELSALGVDYLALPTKDGHVPSPRDVERFAAAVRATDGVVFVHCGAGVGRTSAMTAAYLRATGADPPVMSHFALGAHTAEQMWYVATGDTNVVVRRTSELLDAPRRAWSRIRSVI